MTGNKLVKTIIDAATLTGFAAGIGWALKRRLKRISPQPQHQRNELCQVYPCHGGQHCAQTLPRGPENPLHWIIFV